MTMTMMMMVMVVLLPLFSCSQLGKGQADPPGCKVRADEELDSISELAPGYFVPRATTVYSRLIQHLADEFGYDVRPAIIIACTS